MADLQTKKLTFKEKFMRVQVELKAPKNLYNSFGKYHYRNAEGIQEAVKPLLKEYRLYLNLTDTIEEVGGRVYVKSTARINDLDSEEFAEVTAYAREASEKKGMDDAQVTGATSSYARKYALNGLFLLDDTKDVDTEEYQAATYTESSKNTTKKSTAEKSTEEKSAEEKTERSPARQKLYDFIAENKFTKADQKKIIDKCKLTRESSDEEFEIAIKYAEDMKAQKEREKRPDDYGEVPFEV